MVLVTVRGSDSNRFTSCRRNLLARPIRASGKPHGATFRSRYRRVFRVQTPPRRVPHRDAPRAAIRGWIAPSSQPQFHQRREKAIFRPSGSRSYVGLLGPYLQHANSTFKLDPMGRTRGVALGDSDGATSLKTSCPSLST